jgi:hypothetical protein
MEVVGVTDQEGPQAGDQEVVVPRRRADSSAPSVNVMRGEELGRAGFRWAGGAKIGPSSGGKPFSFILFSALLPSIQTRFKSLF